MAGTGGKRREVLTNVETDDRVALDGKFLRHRDSKAPPTHVAAAHHDRAPRSGASRIDGKRQCFSANGNVDFLRRPRVRGPRDRSNDDTDQRKTRARHEPPPRPVDSSSSLT